MQADDDFSAITPPPVSGGDDKKAQLEQATLENPKVAVQREVHAITIWALRFGALLFGLLVLVRFWHLAGPHYLFGYEVRWLTEAELQSMDKMLFSSTLGGLVLGYLKEIMQPVKKD